MNDDVILFESNTEVPTEFVFEGETIINLGLVIITALPPEEQVP